MHVDNDVNGYKNNVSIDLNTDWTDVNIHCRGMFRTQSNIYDEAFLVKIVNG